MMDKLGSLDSSRSLQTRSVISLHLILQILKIPLQKRKMQSELNTPLDAKFKISNLSHEKRILYA